MYGCIGLGGGSTRTYGHKHDILLFYTKSDHYTFHVLKERSYLTGQLKHSRNKPIEIDEFGFYQTIKFSKTVIRLYRDTRYIEGEGFYTMVNARDCWNIDAVGRSSAERTGHPTQKPLALYTKIIETSTNPGDLVLDPFAGCATTCVVAEKLGRRWVGIDIWQGAPEVIVKCMRREHLYATNKQQTSEDDASNLLIQKDFNFLADVPTRTDERRTAAPHLRVRESVKEPPGIRMTRKEMYEHLLTQYGSKCQGCDREFDDYRYLELDHNTPRADGGINHISNRILLCGPCNRLKSNTLTLSGLRKENKKRGYMQ